MASGKGFWEKGSRGTRQGTGRLGRPLRSGLLFATLSLGLALLTACSPVALAAKAEPTKSPLSTASAVSRLSNQPGRAIVSARGNHFVIDSVVPLKGPNEEVNPLDLMLGALATCGTFVFETAAKEKGIALQGVTVKVEGDFDPRGVAGQKIDPRIQALRVWVDAPGASAPQIETLVEQFRTRCPIYTTLTLAAPVEILTGDQKGSPKIEGLATGTVVSRLSNQPGRAIVTARGNHFVVDSVPGLGGPNEERNPLDLALGALATCGTFVYEAVAREQNIPLQSVVATVEADFDPRGVKGEPVNPRIQALRVHMELGGVSDAQAKKLAKAFQARCPIYTTLTRAAPITIDTVIK